MITHHTLIMRDYEKTKGATTMLNNLFQTIGHLFVPERIQFVRLHREAPAEYVAILNALADSGIQEPVLYGGALRDFYLQGKLVFRDFDVFAKNLPSQSQLAASRSVAFTSLQRFDYGYISTATLADQTRVPLHICLEPFTQDMVSTALRSVSAPINAIAMDRNGQIWAHPKFESDLAARQYVPRWNGGQEYLAYARDHYERLAARIPGLTFHDPRKTWPYAARRILRTDLMP